MNGFSYKKGEIKFKSSAIAKNYSWQNLQKNGLRYDRERDTEYLVGIKNEFTQKLNLESGRDRGTETSESSTARKESGAHQSELSSGKTDRTKLGSDRSPTTGFSYHDSAVKSGEILFSASTLETAKQPAQTKKFLTEPFLDLDIEESISAQKKTQRKLQSLRDQRTKN